MTGRSQFSDGFKKVSARARIFVHEVTRDGELAERRRAHSTDHAGLEVEVYRAGNVLAAQGFEVKHDDATRLRVVVATVLAAAADALLVAHHLPKPGAHLVITLAYLHVHNPARRSSL